MSATRTMVLKVLWDESKSFSMNVSAMCRSKWNSSLSRSDSVICRKTITKAMYRAVWKMMWLST